MRTVTTDWAIAKVLPVLRSLQHRSGQPVRCGKISNKIGVSRRRAYDYLAMLRDVGLVELHGKRWLAV